MDKLEISIDYLAKLAGKSKDDFLTSIRDESGELNENYQSIVEDSIHKKVLDIREGQRKRGFKEGRKEIESFLKTQQIEEYSDISEALTQLQEKFSQSGSKSEGGSNLSLAEIQQLPEVQEWFSSEVKALQDAKAELETGLKQAKNEFHSYKVSSVAKQKAFNALEKAKAVGLNSESIGLYLKALGTSNLDISQDGNVTVLDQDGQPLKDEYHNPIAFEDYMVSNWKFGFSEVPNGSGSPNHKKSGANGKSKIVFRDEAHFNDELKKAGTDNKRIAELTAAFADQLEE